VALALTVVVLTLALAASYKGRGAQEWFSVKQGVAVSQKRGRSIKTTETKKTQQLHVLQLDVYRRRLAGSKDEDRLQEGTIA
jgi:hypothetical protein